MSNVVGANTEVRGVDEGMTVGIRMAVTVGSGIVTISSRNSKVGRVSFTLGFTFSIAIVSGAGDGLVGGVDTGGRFQAIAITVVTSKVVSVVAISIRMSVVSSIQVCGVSLGFSLRGGVGGSHECKDNLRKYQ